jgi:uncharacterized protein (UPF0332 family)
MEQEEKERRWEAAQELSRAANMALQSQMNGACVGLAYYAGFQAMWLALGDPPLGEWRHVGITRRFCHGQWADPVLLPSSLASLYRRLLALYELRLDAHYRARPVSVQQAEQGLETVREVFHLVEQNRKKPPERQS